MINRVVQVSINKADATSLRELVYFSNTGDTDLAWRYTLASNGGAEAIEWFAAPTSGNLTTCDIGNVTLALDFTNAQARAEPYVLTFTMTSSSYLEPSRAILVVLSATVSASARAELCTVNMMNAEELAVADTLEFAVTSIDAYGIRILDVAALTYSATIANHEMLDNDVPCTVAYDVVSDRHGGTCILPKLTWGKFILTVLGSANGRVGNQTYSVPVIRCSVDYYWDGADGVGCVECDSKKGSFCSKGSTLETVLLYPTYWREDASSPLRTVRSCDPRPDNCDGTLNITDSAARGRALTAGSIFDQGCVEGATGPLCATCKPGWVQAADLECTRCDSTNRRNGKIAFGMLLGALLVVGAVIGWFFFGSDDGSDPEGDEVDEAEVKFKKRSILFLLSLARFSDDQR